MGKVRCAWASQDERGKANGGVAGDQTGKEVRVGNWYNFGQTTVIRCLDKAKAKIIAESAEAIALNNCVGYDQYERTTLFTELQKLNWDYNKLKNKCETDCSAMAAVCVNIAGIKISKDVYSGNIVNACKATKSFSILTDKKYLTSGDYLETGDILVAPGKHVVIVCSDGDKVKSESEKVKNEDKTQVITYFNMYIGTSSSLVDALMDVGCPDISIAYRKKIALANNVKNYTGTATQNTQLLGILKRGVLIKP